MRILEQDADTTSAYFMPPQSRPQSQNQSILPAPPTESAIPTPVMLPMPTVPPSAVASDENGDIPSLPPLP